MAGEIRVDTLKTTSGLGTVSFYNEGQIFTGITTFSGSAIGTVEIGTVTTASGIAVTFTGIPSTTKIITVSFNQVIPSGTGSDYVIQLGTSSGYGGATYDSKVFWYSSGGNNATQSNGFIVGTGANGEALAGNILITSMGNNVWCYSGQLNRTGNPFQCCGVGTMTSSIDRLRIYIPNGSATFTSGSINITYQA